MSWWHLSFIHVEYFINILCILWKVFCVVTIQCVTVSVLCHALSRHFLFYFEKSLTFPSCFRYLYLPPVSGVWLSSLIPKVFPPAPLGPSCVQIVCVSLVLCQNVVFFHEPHISPFPWYHSHWSSKPAASDSRAEPFCCKLSLVIVIYLFLNGKFHSQVLFLPFGVIIVLYMFIATSD